MIKKYRSPRVKDTTVIVNNNSDKNENRFNQIINLMKIIIWPITIVFILFIYSNDIMKLLENREFSIGSFKVGEKTYYQNLELSLKLYKVKKDLSDILETDNLDQSKKNIKEIILNVDSLSNILDKNNKELFNQITEYLGELYFEDEVQDIPRLSSYYNNQAFKYMLNKDLSNAIICINKSIHYKLRSAKLKLLYDYLMERWTYYSTANEKEKDKVWKEIYELIIEKYKEELPHSYYEKIQNLVNEMPI